MKQTSKETNLKRNVIYRRREKRQIGRHRQTEKKRESERGKDREREKK